MFDDNQEPDFSGSGAAVEPITQEETATDKAEKTPCQIQAQATFRRVRKMVDRSFAKMVAYAHLGHEIPATFADTTEWRAMADKIDASCAENDLEKTKALCDEYTRRAKKYLAAAEAKFCK